MLAYLSAALPTKKECFITPTPCSHIVAILDLLKMGHGVEDLGLLGVTPGEFLNFATPVFVARYDGRQ
jgi:hypothetical protein